MLKLRTEPLRGVGGGFSATCGQIDCTPVLLLSGERRLKIAYALYDCSLCVGGNYFAQNGKVRTAQNNRIDVATRQPA